ncbi:MAG: hypothetical protein ACJ76H_07565 [Bacteriovoracaceae bacterium]
MDGISRGGKVELNQAIELLKKAVKYPGTIDQKHIDLTLVPTEDKARYEEALKVAQMAIIKGQITRDEFNRRVHLA